MLGSIDLLVCGTYLLIVIGLGVYFSRKQTSSDEYFLGGRNMHWFLVGLSVFAGTFSSLSFVGLPREAAYENYHLYLAILFIPFVVMPIVGYFFLPMFFRLKFTSIYEYLEWRFHRSVRLFSSFLFILYTIGWMGNMLVAVGKILQVVLELNDTQLRLVLLGVGLFATVYTTLGGVKAVIWTDALQAFALGGGMLVVFYLGVSKIDGGFSAFIATAQANDKFDMFKMTWSLTDENLWSACAFGFFVYLSGHSVSFTAAQRYVSMPNIRAARYSLIVNGVMVGAVCLLFFFVGTMLFAFYQQHDPQLFADLGRLGKGDQLLPTFVTQHIPVPGLVGLLLAGLFAAAMSSMDSGINSLTASVVCDWVGGKNVPMMLNRICCAIFGFAAVMAAFVLQTMGGNVFDMIMTIAGTFLGLLLGVFSLGMFSRRANTQGVLIGMCAGTVALLLVMFVFNKSVNHWWYGAFTCLPTVVVGWSASLFFPPPDPKRVDELFWR